MRQAPTPEDPIAALHDRLHGLIKRHFPELQAGPTVELRIGRRSRHRLASVRRGASGPAVTVNPLLLEPGVPEEVCDATLAHELCHILHGFGTATPPKGLKPHRGGIVDAEMDRRGLRALRLDSDAWVRAHWSDWFATNAPDLVVARRQRQTMCDETWDAYLGRPGMRTTADLVRLASRAAASAALPPLGALDWLRATPRQTRLSYRSRNADVVMLHAALAHPLAPEAVLLYQICYWLYEGASARRRRRFADVLRAVLPGDAAAEAERWQRRRWNRFRSAHAPV
ncbi:MAG: hypothetical protein FJX72_17100 [Armatimonadetes bacterium]|nr:hypothetical protein [Armatimonadota bacterium]